MSETGAEVSEEVSRISRRIGVHTLEAFDAGTDPYLDAVLRDYAQRCQEAESHGPRELTARERVDAVVDPGSFVELNPKVSWNDPLTFSDAKGPYAAKAAETSARLTCEASTWYWPLA